MMFNIIAGLLAVAVPMTAQQFDGITVSVDYPGLSLACSEALNTTVSCSSILRSISETNDLLTPTQLTYLCTDECQDSLLVVRKSIQSACSLSTDAIVDAGIAYPATWVIDHYIYTFNSSCRKDKTTNEFCDTVLQSWTNGTDAPSASDQQCSDCVLGIMQLELASPSPIGYNDGDAECFASSTSSCKATGYSYVTPAPYALNGTGAATATSSAVSTTSNSAAAPSCTTGTYKVATGDDCNAVAFAHNVSTFALLYQNNLNSFCADFDPGTEVCLPPQCDVRIVQANDTCLGVVRSIQTAITVTQLQAWNPNLNMLCGNLPRLNGTVICTSPPGGYINVLSSSNSSGGMTPTTAAPIPTNVPVGTNQYCGQFYKVQPMDDCDLISVKKAISLTDFYFLNPEIYSNCTNLQLNASYCVQPVGSISTYANYTSGTATTSNSCFGFSAPTSCFLPETGLPTTVMMAGNYSFPPRTTIPMPTPTPIPLLPLAPGTVSDCYYYQSYIDVNQTMSVGPLLVNNCSYIAQSWEIQVSDLELWNPSLSATDCSFQPGYRYCVLISQNFTLTPAPTVTSSPCQMPQNIVKGTIATCSCYSNIYGYYSDSYPCDQFAADYSLNITTLVSYNSWIGNNCTVSLYDNLTGDEVRSVCVGISSKTDADVALMSADTVEGR